MRYKLKHEKFKIRSNNLVWEGKVVGCRYKFDNRRVEVIEWEGSYMLRFKRFSEGPTAVSVDIGRGVYETEIKISPEAMELIVLQWAEMNGLKIIDDKTITDL